jgi:hypothetical protein
MKMEENMSRSNLRNLEGDTLKLQKMTGKIKWGAESDAAHKQLWTQINSLFRSDGCNWGSNRELSELAWLKLHAPSTDPSPGSSNTNRSSVKDRIFNKTSFSHDPSNAQIWKQNTWMCEMSLGWPLPATPSTINSKLVVTSFKKFAQKMISTAIASSNK